MGPLCHVANVVLSQMCARMRACFHLVLVCRIIGLDKTVHTQSAALGRLYKLDEPLQMNF